MYAFLILAAWRVMLEMSVRLARTRPVFVVLAVLAAGALLYQGKTGGELVFEHGVGVARTVDQEQESTSLPETNADREPSKNGTAVAP
jgi:uncharacterized membrane protein